MSIEINADMLYEIVIRLNGPIDPIGETNTDNRRYENLLRLGDFVHLILQDIYDVSKNMGRHEYSMHRAGKQAVECIESLREY